MTEAVPADEQHVELGDTVACDVRHPYPRTIAVTLATPASVAYARTLLLRNCGWKVISRKGGDAPLA